ncbi:hypothetical protein FNF27_07776 [Cafeteria roenbergensis]|uniref:Uncharacterized protein n=1 Tax=Cafeteria roenbergensis TaxID=33653 RepID=A0A5A8DGX6_CAFRO|nr:hypothetical protein FNF27_07776 [Cafeteria roenbergensis]
MEESLRKLQLDHDAAQNAAQAAEDALAEAESRLMAAEDSCRSGLAREAELEQALQAAGQRSSADAALSRAVLGAVTACALQRVMRQGERLVAAVQAASAWPAPPPSRVHDAVAELVHKDLASCYA